MVWNTTTYDDDLCILNFSFIRLLKLHNCQMSSSAFVGQNFRHPKSTRFLISGTMFVLPHEITELLLYVELG